MNRFEFKGSNIFKLLLFCSTLFLLSACSQNEEQSDFEDQALQSPSGILEMNATGSRVDGGEVDENDWRTAPDFSGLFSVATVAYPNPVPFNSRFEILIDVKAIEAINGLTVYAFQQPSQLTTAQPLVIRQGALQAGLQSIIIQPQEFAPGEGTGTIGNTWRIIFFDGQQKVITYGDVLIE